MPELPHDVGTLLRDPVDAHCVRRLWRRVGEGRIRAWRGERRLRLAVASSVGALTLSVAIVLVSAPDIPGGVLRADGRELTQVSSGESPIELLLEDGASLLLEPATTVAPGRVAESFREVRLLRGRITVEVTPGSLRRFQIDAGVALVEVVGTRFTVDRQATRVHVAVTRGRVRVHDRSSGSGTTLGAGGQLTVGGEASERESPQPRSGRPEVNEGSAEPNPEPEPIVATAPRPRWRELADRGDYEAAWDVVGPRRLRHRLPRAAPDELLALADVARRAGAPADAVAPLERILSHHASDARAPLAAYTLGVVQMDQLRNPAAAAHAFTRARDMDLRGTLAEHALARLAVCRSRMGDHEGAEGAARDYLRTYPDGAMSRQMERLGGD